VRPELNAKHKIQALERRKLLIDALIAFIRTHPNISSEAVLRPLRNRTGLYFYDTAIIRPLWMKGKPVLRLEKYTETITSSEGYNPFDLDARMVCEDVSRMSETKLVRILNKLEKELHPDWDEDDE
jgi:hypothetical protein